MNKRIVLVTANIQGGIVQFVFQLYHTLKAMGCIVKVCLPYQMCGCDIDEIVQEDRLQYHKEKSVISMKPYQAIARQILAIQPDVVWYCDDSVICANIGRYIKDQNVRQFLTLHDAGGRHPTHHDSLRNKVLFCYSYLIKKIFYDRVYRFVLLSPESKTAFCARFPKYCMRVACMNLGAHIPRCTESMPKEFIGREKEPYLLFFGRIDKYKGIENLVRAYKRVEHGALPLIIAGAGVLTENEKKMIESTRKVTLINRYISNGEMKWLFANTTSVVLPYIEASQSGVIPIAYAYGKPVIVSNVQGLTQFVRNSKTGFVTKDIITLGEAMASMSVNRANAMRANVNRYYREHMDWKQNIEKMFATTYEGVEKVDYA